MAGKKAETLGEEWINEIPEGWLEESTGFAPYWTPEVGKKFTAMVIDIDTSDPTFGRYILQNMDEEAITCQRGPASDAEEVVVGSGEQFTCSMYASLDLSRYIGETIKVLVHGNRKLAGNDDSDGKPRDLWMWKLMVSPETAKRLQSYRAEEAKMLREAAVKARMEGNLVLGRPGKRRGLLSSKATSNNADAE